MNNYCYFLFQCDSEGDEGDDDKVSEKICEIGKNKPLFSPFEMNSIFRDSLNLPLRLF